MCNIVHFYIGKFNKNRMARYLIFYNNNNNNNEIHIFIDNICHILRDMELIGPIGLMHSHPIAMIELRSFGNSMNYANT